MIEELLYLDREYISNQYELITGTSPSVIICKTEGLTAAMRIPILSSGISSVESKSFELSTISMLIKISEELDKKPSYDSITHKVGKTSSYCWVNGYMTVRKVTLKRNRHTLTLIGQQNDNNSSMEEISSEEGYFSIRDSNECRFSLLTKNDYFNSGIDSIIDFTGTRANEILFPIRALIRVLPVKSGFGEWLSVPLLIFEHSDL